MMNADSDTKIYDDRTKLYPVKKKNLFGDFYYGWVIVAIGLLSMVFWMGIRSGFSVFYVALLDEFQWSRGSSAGVQSVSMIVYTICAPVVGSLIDRFGPRKVIAAGVLVLSCGLILSALIQNLAQFFLFYGVIMGVGITSIGIVSYSSIIAHWFEKKRGLASGIAVSGMGLGTFLMVPLAQQLISSWGWRATFLVFGALVLVILLPLNGIFLRHKPEEMGEYPDGADYPVFPECEENKNGGNKCSPEAEWTLRKALRTVQFWALIAFSALVVGGVFVVLVHSVRFLVDQGLSKMTAAMMFAMVGIVSSIFRIFWGWLSDRIGREITFTLGAICGCLGYASLLLMAVTGKQFFVYTFFVFFGMGWGGSAPLLMAVSADLFKGRIFGLIYGIVEGSVGLAGAFGAWIAGFIFDQTGSYQWAFVLAIAATLLSIVFVWIAAPRHAQAFRRKNL
ncbi:MFS transporter [Thermodesulfobacteriota bacterium]